jgi:hypothetical protein
MSVESLPATMRDALRAELDEHEVVRWTSQPVASRVFWQMLHVGIWSLVGISLPLGGLLYLCIDTMREVAGTPAHDEAVRALVPMAGVSLILVTCAVLGIREPWRARRTAERTVYAVTQRRIVVLRTDRRGRVRIVSLEPTHPMLVVRRENRDGSGDVMIGRRTRVYDHPTPPPHGIVLAATPDPRRVERIIRRTFDPPAARVPR